MSLSLPGSGVRGPVAIGLAMVAFGVAGCGGSDDGGDAGASGASDADKARAQVERLYAAIRAKDAEGVCATMTEPAQKQVAKGGIGTGGGRTCADAFQRFLDAAERQGGLNLTLKAKVERVEVNGDRAVAKVAFGKARSGDVPLVKQDGEWKLDRAGAAP